MLGSAIFPYCQVFLLPAWCWAMSSSLTVRFFSCQPDAGLCHPPLLSSLSCQPDAGLCHPPLLSGLLPAWCWVMPSSFTVKSLSYQPDAGLCHPPLLSGLSPASLMLGYAIQPYCQVSPASLMLGYAIFPYGQVFLLPSSLTVKSLSCQPDAGICHLPLGLSPASLMLGYAIFPYCQVSPASLILEYATFP